MHAAVFRPWGLARELWLDRLLLLLAVLLVAVGFGSALHLLGGAGGGGALVALALLLPPFLLYAWSVRSHLKDADPAMLRGAVQLARISGARRIILGHTHRERSGKVEGVEILNTGHWSPAYRDLACEEPVGTRGFAWLQAGPEGRMEAELRVFDGLGSHRYREPEAEGAARTGLAAAQGGAGVGKDQRGTSGAEVPC